MLALLTQSRTLRPWMQFGSPTVMPLPMSIQLKSFDVVLAPTQTTTTTAATRDVASAVETAAIAALAAAAAAAAAEPAAAVEPAGPAPVAITETAMAAEEAPSTMATDNNNNYMNAQKKLQLASVENATICPAKNAKRLSSKIPTIIRNRKVNKGNISNQQQKQAAESAASGQQQATRVVVKQVTSTATAKAVASKASYATDTVTASSGSLNSYTTVATSTWHSTSTSPAFGFGSSSVNCVCGWTSGGAGPCRATVAGTGIGTVSGAGSGGSLIPVRSTRTSRGRILLAHGKWRSQISNIGGNNSPSPPTSHTLTTTTSSLHNSREKFKRLGHLNCKCPKHNERGHIIDPLKRSASKQQFLRFLCCDQKQISVPIQLISRYSSFVIERQRKTSFCFCRPIQLETISSVILLRLVLWMEKHYDDDLNQLVRDQPTLSNAKTDNCTWDESFLGFDAHSVLQLLLAANCLSIHPLMEHIMLYFIQVMQQHNGSKVQFKELHEMASKQLMSSDYNWHWSTASDNGLQMRN